MKAILILSFLFLIIISCKKDDKKKIDDGGLTGLPVAVSGGGMYDYDSNYYSTTIITYAGEWTTSNLKTAHFSNGDTIYSGRNLDDISAMSQPKFFFYVNNDSLSSMKKYGRLYTFYVIDDARNVCPAGWHVPTKNDWDTLKKYLGGQEVAGGKLKSTGSWTSPNAGADNSTYFAAIPAGFREPEEVYAEVGKTAIFWTPSPDTANRAWAYYVKYNYPSLFQAPFEKNKAFSVRCKRD